MIILCPLSQMLHQTIALFALKQESPRLKSSLQNTVSLTKWLPLWVLLPKHIRVNSPSNRLKKKNQLIVYTYFKDSQNDANCQNNILIQLKSIWDYLLTNIWRSLQHLPYEASFLSKFGNVARHSSFRGKPTMQRCHKYRFLWHRANAQTSVIQHWNNFWSC